MIALFIQYLAFWLFPLVMTYAAWSDLFSMTISNRLSLVLVPGFFLLAPFAGIGLEAMSMHLAVAGIALGLGFFCFAMNWVGGGDAKIAAVAALWLGPDNMVDFVALASLLGGALTLFVMNFRHALLPAVLARRDWVARLHDGESGVPYGIALSAAALWAYPHSAWVGLVTG